MQSHLTRILRVTCVLVTAVFSGSVSSQSANEVTKMVVLELPGLTSPGKEGAYANVYNALQSKRLVKHWFAAPSRRAHSIFLNKEADCIAPASLDLVDRYNYNRDDFSVTAPFNKAVGKVMFAVSPPAKTGDRPIMGVVGFGVQHGVEPGLYKIEDLPDYDKLLQLIEENRIDAAYIMFPDVEQISGSTERIERFKGKVEVRWEGTDSILCWKELGPAVEVMSDQLHDWRQSKYLHTLLGAYFVE
ncbi:MAG: hypothetical protein AB3N28_12010 [Kordiimonas sp.]